MDFLELEERFIQRVHNVVRSDKELVFRVHCLAKSFFKMILGLCLFISGVAVALAVNEKLQLHDLSAAARRSLPVVLGLTQVVFMSLIVFLLFSVVAEVWLRGKDMKETVERGHLLSRLPRWLVLMATGQVFLLAALITVVAV